MTLDPKYSPDAIRDIVREHDYHWLDHHECSLCGTMVGYEFFDGAVFFNSKCDCPSPTPNFPRISSYMEISDWLDMQGDDDTRDRILTRFKPTRYT